MSENCIFCKIVAGQIPAKKLYEDEEILAFWDIDPVAPRHFLVIPKKHLAGPAAVAAEDKALIGKLVQDASRLAQENGIPHFRMVMNNGSGSGQTVFHLHMHVLGGRPLAWPPG